MKERKNILAYENLPKSYNLKEIGCTCKATKQFSSDCLSWTGFATQHLSSTATPGAYQSLSVATKEPFSEPSYVVANDTISNSLIFFKYSQVFSHSACTH